MNKIIIILFLLIFNSYSYSNEIKFIDLQFLLNNSKLYQSIDSSLIEANNKIKAELQLKESKIKKKENELISKRKIISEEEFNKEVLALNKELKNYNDERSNILNDFNLKKENEYKKFYNKLNQVLIEYSKKENLDIIIDKKYILISRSDDDITKSVLKLMNN
jgi:outer membrane protein